MIFKLGMIAMAAAASMQPAEPPPRPHQPARTSVPLPSLFTIDDYPIAARRYELEGRTAVILAIDTSGRVDGCTVAASSGHAILDTATCRLLVERARFTPARNRAGRRVRDSIRTAIRWALPPPMVAPVPPVT